MTVKADKIMMSSRGKTGEMEVLGELLDRHPTGALVVPADTFDVYRFVGQTAKLYRDRVLSRDGVFIFLVSTTGDHETSEKLTAYLTSIIGSLFGFDGPGPDMKLNPKVRVEWSTQV